MGEKNTEVSKQLEIGGLYYGPSDRQLYGREYVENTQLYKMLQSQRGVIEKYKIALADTETIILKAFAEFSTTDHQMSGEFRPWLSVEAQKRLYWILKNFIDNAEKQNESR